MNSVELTVNTRAVKKDIEPRTSLADLMRDMLDLTGTHLGCEHGVCGACTILVDGVPTRSCITYAVACDGADVTTIEGLDDDEIADELRAAFTREHALQCGYCTPGMLVSARDLVKRLPDADEQQIRIGMSGNLCRCTGYVGIVRAVQSVISERRARDIAPEPDGGRKVLGPAGSGHATCVSSQKLAVAKPVVHAPSEAVAPLDIPDFTPSTTLEQQFTVAHPSAKVFALFDDIAAVASCLPGATLVGTPKPERVEGAIRVKIGPISANFNGAARVERDEANLSGRILGVGNDQRSRSTTQGEIRYRLVPLDKGAATRVELTIGYSLTGVLAQVGRSGLVRDLAARLVAEFAGNLDRRLSGDVRSAPSAAADLNGVSLILGLLRERAMHVVRRLTGRGGSA
ncbi:xanthine dehydrogenase family Fe-S subunit [Tardiphaga robiniae]|uniref:Carbon monoxide dehydrogenase n=1 Tax=Tardiphaga robiniae TaxID=943830 RepID=A0A109ZY01_9BRAD|nr:2Fe-2S iron-sulfur cluster-binding protein [Tardiphaga robiniae]AMH39358.1 Carbon monoxide dehydrogenase small chain [Tardiphaga robiniae]KZD25365.1 carbon monoxide dehydrogenase [Tardiphaga robiniae]